MGADYSKMTSDDFDELLAERIDGFCENRGGSAVLQIPGIYEIMSEYFNNEVLEAWEEENPALAYPEDYKEER